MTDYPKALYRKDGKGVVRMLTVNNAAEEAEFHSGKYGFVTNIKDTGSETHPSHGKGTPLSPMTQTEAREIGSIKQVPVAPQPKTPTHVSTAGMTKAEQASVIKDEKDATARAAAPKGKPHA